MQRDGLLGQIVLSDRNCLRQGDAPIGFLCVLPNVELEYWPNTITSKAYGQVNDAAVDCARFPAWID